MKKILRFIFKLDDYIGMIAMAVTIGIIIINVLLRAIFSKSIICAEEIAFIAFSWAVFLGASSCFKRKMHIGVDLLINALPSKTQHICTIIIDVILVGLNAFFACLSCVFAVSAYFKPTSILGISYTFIDISAPIAFVFMTVYSVIFLLMDLHILDAAKFDYFSVGGKDD